MPQLPRTIECDVCHMETTEPDVNLGFKGWSIIKGIGSCAPADDESLQVRHTETCLCPYCTAEVSNHIDSMQELRR